MKKRVFGRKLSRDIKERKALFRSLVGALILHGKIKTTYAKGKAVASLIEKLVTKAKDGSRSSVTQITSFLNRKELINKLVSDIAPNFKDKLGGYIRMIRVGRRAGDAAQEVIMEWTVKSEKSPGKIPEKTAKKEIKKKIEKPVKAKSPVKPKRSTKK